ncbi:hypothetical protein ACWEKT_00915 [Nocardia takedensis]
MILLSRPLARAAAVLAALTLPALAAGTAAAADTIDVTGANPATVELSYSCDAPTIVTSAKAMVGEPTADRPAALGMQEAVTCDGAQRTTTIALVAAPGQAPLPPGAIMQVRVALVDRNDLVVAGQNKILQLGS